MCHKVTTLAAAARRVPNQAGVAPQLARQGPARLEVLGIDANCATVAATQNLWLGLVQVYREPATAILLADENVLTLRGVLLHLGGAAHSQLARALWAGQGLGHRAGPVPT